MAALPYVVGCTVRVVDHPNYPTGSTLEAPIVLVHGYKGSALSTHAGERRYPLITQAFGFGDVDLSLEPVWHTHVQSRADGLREAGMLESIVIIPALIELPIYGPFVQSARDRRRAVYAFSYDWRRDNLETLARLENYVRGVSLRHNGRPVELVGHSLGGLLALALVNHDPQHIGRLVLAGAPLAGGVGGLIDLNEGSAVGINREVLQPNVVATFASLLAFFPLENHDAVDERGQPLPIDFYRRSDWQRWRIGGYMHGPSAMMDRHLDHALPLARRFRALKRNAS